MNADQRGNCAILSSLRRSDLTAISSGTTEFTLKHTRIEMEAASKDQGTPGSSPSGGRILEEYRLIHTLGKGHFATVKLAQRMTTNKMVALKIIDYDASAPRQQELIRRELTAMQEVQHENVLQLERTVLNVQREDGREVMLMELELAPGGELFDYILTGGAFPEPVARAYMKQLLSALHECHRVGVYHRDIKPENILLNENFQLKVPLAWGRRRLASHDALVAFVFTRPSYCPSQGGRLWVGVAQPGERVAPHNVRHEVVPGARDTQQADV